MAKKKATRRKQTTKHMVTLELDIEPFLNELASCLSRDLAYYAERVSEEMNLGESIAESIEEDVRKRISEGDVREALIKRAVDRIKKGLV